MISVFENLTRVRKVPHVKHRQANRCNEAHVRLRTKGLGTREERAIKKRLSLPTKIIHIKMVAHIYLCQINKVCLLFL